MSGASASANAVDSTSTRRPWPLLLKISDNFSSADQRIKGESHIVLIENSELNQDGISVIGPKGAERVMQRLRDTEGDTNETDMSNLLIPTAATWKRVVSKIYQTRVGLDSVSQRAHYHDGLCVFEIYKDAEICSRPDGRRWKYSELGPAVTSAAETLPRSTLQLLDHHSTEGSAPLGFTISFRPATKSLIEEIVTNRTLCLPSAASAASAAPATPAA